MTSSNRELLLDPKYDRAEAVGGIPVTRACSALSEAPALVRELTQGPLEERPDAVVVMHTMGALTAEGLRRHDTQLFVAGIDSFAACWLFAPPEAMFPNRTPDDAAFLWENLVIELYALGALAVEQERWGEIRELTLQNPSGRFRESWLRQGQTVSARTAEPDDSLFLIVERRALELGVQRPLESLCRFDLLAALVVAESAPHDIYPNAAEFGEHLVESFVIEELRDARGSLRQHVFKGDDTGLRSALVEYDTRARTHAAVQRYVGADWKWRAFQDARTCVFLREGQLLEEWMGAPRVASG